MKRSILKNPLFKSIFLTIFVILIIIPISLILNGNFNKNLLQDERDKVDGSLSLYSTSLDKAIASKSSIIFALEGFTMLHVNDMISEEFEMFASGLVTSTGGIRNVILAPGGINTYVYPLEGNEAAVGHDLINDEREHVRDVVAEAIETKRLTSSGPYELRQGGAGLIFRKAIYQDDAFWGLVTFVIDFDILLDYVHLNNGVSLIDIVVYSQSDIFFGDAETLDQDPVIQSVALPNGSIEIAAIPKVGWDNAIKNQLRMFQTLMIVTSILIVALVFILSYMNNIMRTSIASKVLQLRKIHNMLRKKQNLESIGTLASGVAHEINNPLNGIINYAQIILDSSDEESKNYEYTKEIIRESNRVAKIVRSLMSFSSQENHEYIIIKLSKLAEEVLVLINTVISLDEITLETYPCKHLPYVMCSPQQIKQILMNLLTNARYALNQKYPGYHENKIMKISCGTIKKEKEKFVRITVEDHGGGIPEGVQTKLFEPFFSTKDRFEGTGLGLSICYGIAKEHGGELSLETKIGKYTKFYLDLPILKDEK